MFFKKEKKAYLHLHPVRGRLVPKGKRSLEMGFNWLFAIIVGGFILFLAIFVSTKVIGIGQNTINTETSAKFISLFDPLETGLASGKKTEITLAKKSKIYFTCDSTINQPFGQQTISFSEQTFGSRYGEKNTGVPVRDKYIFTEDLLEGKSFYLFSKPFFMPFKVADIVILGTGDYCFYNAPDNIKEDLEGLDLKMIHFPNKTGKCEGKKVCFGGTSNCDIKVSLAENYVYKDGKRLYYKDDLIYGAIFASPDIYECNLRRLMKKLNELGVIYADKINVIERKKCNPQVGEKIVLLMVSTQKFSSSKELATLYSLSQEINQINEEANSGCRLYSNAESGFF